MAGGHDPCRPVQRRTEVVVAAPFSLAGRDAHAHRQLQLVLRLDRGVDRRRGD